MDGTGWEQLVERLTASRGRRSLLAGLAGASLIGGAAGLLDDASAKKKKKKATICRNGQTLSVTKRKKQKHLLPGDTPGRCPAPRTTTAPPSTSTTSTSTTTSEPICPDVQPTDDLQAAINDAESGSILKLCPGTFRVTTTLEIEKDLTLAGAGVEETILDGEGQVRVLLIGGSRTVTVERLAITRGFVAGQERGGGIVNSGDLTLRRVTVNFCEAHKGGGIALFRESTLTMNENSVVEHNTSRDDGGGIHNDGTVTMNEGSFVKGNTAGNGGGGIMSLIGSLTMNGGSFVTENTALGASGGGGIGGFGAWITLNSGSTVEGNDPDNCATESGACS